MRLRDKDILRSLPVVFLLLFGVVGQHGSLSDARSQYEQRRYHFALRTRLGHDRHYHIRPVAGYCLQASWKYEIFDWIARPGTLVYERAGEAHSLQVLGNETMVTFFRVMGPHIRLDREGRYIGYFYAFRMLDYCRRYYEENGLDPSYLDKITR